VENSPYGKLNRRVSANAASRNRPLSRSLVELNFRTIGSHRLHGVMEDQSKGTARAQDWAHSMAQVLRKYPRAPGTAGNGWY